MNTTEVFPHIDASQRDCITDEQANFFRQNGLLVIRNVLKPDELSALQEQTLPFVQRAMKEKVEDPDYFYRRHEITGQPTPFRIEYIIDKTDAAKSLLAHPFILRSVEKLQGPNFIPTWDSMVFKTAGAGAAVPWHRDAGPECTVPDKPIFNVDFYLDHADITNCLWGILGSNNWTEQQAQRRIQDLNTNGFQTDAQTVPILMKPGDVIFHNILVLHGSPPSTSALRRVIYFEFRPAEVEQSLGPHTPAYIPLKQKVLQACLRHRANSPFARDENPFVYRPSDQFSNFSADDQLPTYRYPHNDYWRQR